MNSELQFNDENVTLVKEIGEILKSRTQSIKVLLVEKDNERFVSIQKWWRRDSEEAWREGKGFHLSLPESKDIEKFIEIARGVE